MSNQVHNRITDSAKKREKQFAVLIDPDKIDGKSLGRIIDLAVDSHVDYFFVGGSLMVNNFLDECLQIISESCDIPTVLFPGSPAQVSPFADAILLLSLVSGRNPNLLIGEQVLAAPAIKRSGLEVISTGYMLVDGGKPTTVSYISNTTPIPQDKPDIAVCTAMAAEMLGFKTIYLDTGSGAKHSVSSEMINAAKSNISIPLIVGGGITTPEKAAEVCQAGADIVVVGNALEKSPNLVRDISIAVHANAKPAALHG